MLGVSVNVTVIIVVTLSLYHGHDIIHMSLCKQKTYMPLQSCIYKSYYNFTQQHIYSFSLSLVVHLLISQFNQFFFSCIGCKAFS